MGMFEVVILLVTAAMMVFGLWGTLSLTQVHISPEKRKLSMLGVIFHFYLSTAIKGMANPYQTLC